MGKIYIWFCFIYLCSSPTLLAQKTDGDRFHSKAESLDNRVKQNGRLSLTDPEELYRNIDELLEEAVETGNHEAELIMLAQRCWYYNHKMDLEKSLKANRALQDKANQYNDVFHLMLVHLNFSQTYALSRLPDKSIAEFEEAMKMFRRLDNNDLLVIDTKIKAYHTVSNAYLYKEDYPQMIKMLLRANGEIERITDADKRKIRQWLNYSNLGIAYLNSNLDSAEYYARKSMEVQRPQEETSTPQFANYVILGSAHKKRNEFQEAVAYYKKAESMDLQSRASLSGTEELYQGLADIYKQTDSIEQARSYSEKLNAVQLEIEKNKNESLHEIIDTKLLEDQTSKVYIIAGSAIIIFFLLGMVLWFRRKSRLLAQQEKISQEYLEEIKQHPQTEEKDYTKLVDMLKSGDSAFMVSFLEIFPGFIEKIREIHPKVVQSELEFCAMMKLNLSTKETARILNIEPKSVHVKKYRIRKKLNIPDDTDIYMWFSQI